MRAVGWDKSEATINKAGVTFTGTWSFVANTYNVHYAFEKDASVPEGIALPQAIEQRVPQSEADKENQATVTPAAVIDLSYEDTENDGTWTFVENSPTPDSTRIDEARKVLPKTGMRESMFTSVAGVLSLVGLCAIFTRKTLSSKNISK